MKKVIYSAFLIANLFAAQATFAVTCKVLEADGQEASAKTKIEAEKLAWKACISNKLAKREALRGPVDADDALMDAEPCINGKLLCR